MNRLPIIYTSIAIFIFLLTTYLHPSHAQTFTSEPISGEVLEAMQQGNTWKAASSVPPERLRLLTIQHINFQGEQQLGHLIVLDVCQEAVLNIFKALYDRKFPIHQLKPMHHYQGNDHAAVTDNNTSCYIDRNISGTTKKSVHAYGLAIDINPWQNPFIITDKNKGIATYEPSAGVAYANRLVTRLGKVTRTGMAEEVVDLFAAHGFYWWGGYWDIPIDYQHFQVDLMLAELYLAMKPSKAKALFKTMTQYFNTYQRPLERELLQVLNKEKIEAQCSLLSYYTKNKKCFKKCLKELTSTM